MEGRGSAENGKTKAKSEPRARSRLVEGREELRMAEFIQSARERDVRAKRKIKIAIALFQELKRAEGTTMWRS
jgi:hypothetical protein